MKAALLILAALVAVAAASPAFGDRTGARKYVVKRVYVPRDGQRRVIYRLSPRRARQSGETSEAYAQESAESDESGDASGEASGQAEVQDGAEVEAVGVGEKQHAAEEEEDAIVIYEPSSDANGPPPAAATAGHATYGPVEDAESDESDEPSESSAQSSEAESSEPESSEAEVAVSDSDESGAEAEAESESAASQEGGEADSAAAEESHAESEGEPQAAAQPEFTPFYDNEQQQQAYEVNQVHKVEGGYSLAEEGKSVRKTEAKEESKVFKDVEDVKTFNSEVHEYEYYPYEGYGKQVTVVEPILGKTYSYLAAPHASHQRGYEALRTVSHVPIQSPLLRYGHAFQTREPGYSFQHDDATYDALLTPQNAASGGHADPLYRANDAHPVSGGHFYGPVYGGGSAGHGYPVAVPFAADAGGTAGEDSGADSVSAGSQKHEVAVSPPDPARAAGLARRRSITHVPQNVQSVPQQSSSYPVVPPIDYGLVYASGHVLPAGPYGDGYGSRHVRTGHIPGYFVRCVHTGHGPSSVSLVPMEEKE